MSGEALETTTVTEVLAAAKNSSGRWHLASIRTSNLFEYCLGSGWDTFLYAPYYEDFWSGVLAALEEASLPVVEVELLTTYKTGVLPAGDLDEEMKRWSVGRQTKTKPNALAVTEMGLETTIAHMEIDDIKVTAVQHV